MPYFRPGVRWGLALAEVAGANPNRIEPVEHIQFGGGNRPNPVERHAVAGHHRVEPPDPPRAARGGAVLDTDLANLLSQVVRQLGGHRPVADPGGVRLEDADRQIDGAGWDARTRQRAAGGRRGRRHVWICPEVEIEHAPLRTLEENADVSRQRILNAGENIFDVRAGAFDLR